MMASGAKAKGGAKVNRSDEDVNTSAEAECVSPLRSPLQETEDIKCKKKATLFRYILSRAGRQTPGHIFLFF